MARIVLIDDGINEGFFGGGHKPEPNLTVAEDLSVQTRVDYDRFRFSHGTVCSAIVLKEAPRSRLSSIKILDDVTKRSTVDQLCVALDLCVSMEPDLVNVSLGTIQREDFPLVGRHVRKLIEQGTTVVAAADNLGCYTLPAAFEGVVGVACFPTSPAVPNQARAVRLNPNARNVNVLATGDYDLRNYLQARYRSRNPSNSFAAALTTGMLGSILADQPELRSLELISVLNSVLKPSVDECALYPQGGKSPGVPIVFFSSSSQQALPLIERMTEYFIGQGIYPATLVPGEESVRVHWCGNDFTVRSRVDRRSLTSLASEISAEILFVWAAEEKEIFEPADIVCRLKWDRHKKISCKVLLGHGPLLRLVSCILAEEFSLDGDVDTAAVALAIRLLKRLQR